MGIIRVSSFQHAVSKGALIDLANDYRTSRTLRAWLPPQDSCAFAISAAAYDRHVQQGAVAQQQSRMEALCAFLSKAAGLGDKPSQSEIQARPGRHGETTSEFPLKVEWFAPSKCWVILLPDEELQEIRPAR